MESRRFDELTKTLSSGTTRRGMLKGLLGGGAGGALGMLGLSRGAAQPNKVGVCHLTGNGSYRYIEVSTNAVPAHEWHEDTINPDFSNDVTNCGDCGNVCSSAPEHATATCIGGECGFTCTEGYQVSSAGDACEAIFACPEGYEELNGGCFQTVSGLGGTCPDGCAVYRSVIGSENYLCAKWLDSYTYCSTTNDCPSGSACFAGYGLCIHAC